MFIFLQEHWLSAHESKEKILSGLPKYNCLSTSSDMFSNPEERMLESGPTWHGTAVLWPEKMSKYVTQMPIINDRFCGIRYIDKKRSINILA